jgi:tetratricopeptide (TPR) repeat protein
MVWALEQYNERDVSDFQKAIFARTLGEAYYLKGYFDRANGYLIESLALLEKLNAQKETARTHNLLGRVYQYSRQWELALDHYRESLQIFTQTNDTRGMAEAFGNIGHFYEKKAIYDSALYYQRRAMGIYQSLQDQKGQARIYDNIGSIHEDLAEYEKALTAFERARGINLAIHNESEALINQNNIGDVYRKTRSYQRALAETGKALEEAKRLDQPYQIRSAFRDLSKIHEGIGEYGKAFHYLDSAYDMTDQIYSEQIAREMAGTRAIYELDKKENQIALLQKDQKIGRFYRWTLLAGLLLFIIIGALIYYQQYTRIQKNKKLYEAEKRLAQANEEKLKADIQFKKATEEKLQQEIASKSQELTTNALHIIQKNEFLENLKGELKAIGNTESEKVNKQLKKIRKSIDYNFNLDDDWQEFESIFQSVHHDFFEELQSKFPDLTSAEMRLCAMLRLNMSSKDMATVLGISQDSLRISRYRLRKKLGMEKGANLYSFIMSIG